MLGNIVSRPARDLTFSLSKVLNDITGIAKHYWMNVMIDVAMAQSDRRPIICSGDVQNFGLHASLRSVRVNWEHSNQSSSCVQTGWNRFICFCSS